MTKIVTFLSTLSLSLTAVAAPVAGNGASPVGNLSRCEQELVASMGPARTRAWLEGVAGVAAGAISGTGIFATGFAIQSIGSSSDAVMGVSVTDPEMAGIIISAVATGTVIAAIGIGSAYQDYRQTVDQQEALLQLFKDVRNNGRGAMIDLRVAVIQKTLRKLQRKSRGIFRAQTGTELNEASVSDGAIRLALMQVVGEYGTSNLLDCKMPADVSMNIDKATLRNVIKKFNPALSVKVK